MKEKVLAILLCGMIALSLAACSSSGSSGKSGGSDDVTFSATEETDDSGTVFTVETNLPEGTILNLYLNGEDYIEQKETTVADGRAVSDAFSDNGGPLKGDFSLTVTIVEADEQPAEVQKIIGSKGEKLTGDLVTTYTFGGSSAKKTFNFSF